MPCGGLKHALPEAEASHGCFAILNRYLCQYYQSLRPVYTQNLSMLRASQYQTRFFISLSELALARTLDIEPFRNPTPTVPKQSISILEPFDFKPENSSSRSTRLTSVKPYDDHPSCSSIPNHGPGEPLLAGARGWLIFGTPSLYPSLAQILSLPPARPAVPIPRLFLCACIFCISISLSLCGSKSSGRHKATKQRLFLATARLGDGVSAL